MKLNEAKKNQWEQKLRELNYISGDDQIIEHVGGDKWELATQTSGNFFFTNEKFIFVANFLGSGSFSVNYSDIKELKLVNVGGLIPLIPTGILVSVQNPENGKMEKHKCSVMKRKQWLEFLRTKANL